MPIKYMDAPEVEVVANEIIREYHPHLTDVRFFFFGSYTADGELKPVEKCGDRLGYARLYPAEHRAILDAPDFGIGISYNHWTLLDDAQKRALIDHECMHCRYKEMDSDDLDAVPAPYLYKHEFQGFVEELERHGAWTLTYKAVAKQLTLALDGVA